MESQPLLSGRRQGAISQVDLADALDLFGFRTFHLFIFLVGFLLNAIGSSIISPVPFVVDKIMQEYGIGKGTAALVQGCVTGGSIFGSLAGGLLGDKYGRKICTVFCVALSLGVGLMHFFVPGDDVGLSILLSLRVSLGVAFAGMMLLQTVLVFEYVPTTWRATIYAVSGLGWSTFSIICWLCLATFKMDWRVSMGVFTFATSLIALGPICLMSETPRWLFINGYRDEGYRVFQRILDSTLLSGENCGLSTPPHVLVQKVSKERTLLEQLPLLFNSNFRVTTIVGCLMWTATAGNSYSATLWLPTIIRDISGAAAFDYQLFIVAELASVLATLVSIWALDLCGRRASYIASAIAVALFQGLCALFASRNEHVFLMASLSALNAAFVINWIALGTIVTEFYPTVLRATGGGFCMSVGRVSATLLPIAVGAILEVSMHWAVAFLLSTILIGAFAAFFVGETANMKLADDV